MRNRKSRITQGYLFHQICILLRGLEARAGLGRGAGHLVVTSDDGLGKMAMEVEEESDERGTLLESASVLRFAVGVEAAFIADADGAAIEGAAVSAYFIQAAVLSHRAILADVVVITDVEEASREVVALELLGSVVLGLASGGTVNDDEADGVLGHEHAGVDISKEVVLGGDLVATDGERKCFLNHSHAMQESKIIAPSKAEAMVAMALNTGLLNRRPKFNRNLLILLKN